MAYLLDTDPDDSRPDAMVARLSEMSETKPHEQEMAEIERIEEAMPETEELTKAAFYGPPKQKQAEDAKPEPVKAAFNVGEKFTTMATSGIAGELTLTVEERRFENGRWEYRSGEDWFPRDKMTPK
ncbi:hypothetical protein LTR17_020292 [Elasticomyces elasticus]|nr:hypothetical protein LTR17_020292 [Elasticomyces elasticus]